MKYIESCLYFVIFLNVFAFSFVSGEEDKQKCVNDIIEWCSKQYYQYAGNSVVSYTEMINGYFEDVQCISNRNGLRCTKNGYPWYFCFSDGTATYKETKLQQDSLDGVDEEICYTASRLNRRAEISAEVKETLVETKAQIGETMRNVRERLVDSSRQLQDNMRNMRERLYESNRNLQDNMRKLREKLGRKCFPFCRDDSSDVSIWSW